MFIALINLEDDTILDLREATPDETGALNAATQECDPRLEWRALSPFEIGLIIGQTLPIVVALAQEN